MLHQVVVVTVYNLTEGAVSLSLKAGLQQQTLMVDDTLFIQKAKAKLWVHKIKTIDRAENAKTTQYNIMHEVQ